jgi:hypothetical protein
MRKRAISHSNLQDISRPIYQYEKIHRGRKGDCLACKGETIDCRRSRKRIALGEIPLNLGRGGRRRSSYYGYKQCDASLCKEGQYWAVFHNISSN